MKNFIRKWLGIENYPSEEVLVDRITRLAARRALNEANFHENMEKRETSAVVHAYVSSEEFIDKVVARIRDKQI